MARQNNSHRSGLGGHLDLGNAHVLPVSGIETVKVHPRNELPQDAEFGRAVDRASVKEKSFYEGRIFTFAKDLINASNCPRAVEILGAAEQGGGARAKALEASNRKGQFGSPALRELVRELRSAIREGAGDESEEQSKLRDIYKKIVIKLYESSRGKFGITVAGVDPAGTAQLEVRQVSSPAYFGLSKTDMPTAWRERCMATGVCMIVKTSDNQLLVQYRTKQNAQYSEIPGASIAGMFDAQPADGYAADIAAIHLEALAAGRDVERARTASRGLVGPITTASVLRQIKTEAREELGLRERIVAARVVGIAEDLTKPHHEIVLLGTVDFTAAAIVDRAKAKYDGDAQKFDIPEWCVGIPATGAAVAVLLTKVQVPLPPTHAAAFLAAGKALVTESEGAAAAERWEADTVRAYRENLTRIDALCQTVTGMPYDPMKRASEQGLGNPIQQLREELGKVGMTMTAAQPARETNRAVLTEIRARGEGLWCFDIDGVLTSGPEKIVNQTAIAEAVELLRRGNTVALNTGRSLDWAVQNVGLEIVRRAVELGVEPERLKTRFVIAGEKGAALASWDGAQFVETLSPEYVVPDNARQAIRAFSEREGVRESVVVDEGKKAMVTLEMRTGFSHLEFERIRPELQLAVEAILTDGGLADRFRVDATTIAVDVEHRASGKALASSLIEDFFKARGGGAWKGVVTVGDSASDIDMANYFGPRFRTTHVHVGSPVAPRPDASFHLETTAERYDVGTVAFLRGLRGTTPA
jgi:hypothetical protein